MSVEATDVVLRTSQTRDPRVVIEYCKQCRWMLRAAWYAQELLTTFQDQIGEVALQPSSGGRFFVTVQINGQAKLVWDRKERGGFPGKLHRKTPAGKSEEDSKSLILCK
jgi:selT/selW/selH-like putative selenoprotein